MAGRRFWRKELGSRDTSEGAVKSSVGGDEDLT